MNVRLYRGAPSLRQPAYGECGKHKRHHRVDWAGNPFGRLVEAPTTPDCCRSRYCSEASSCWLLIPSQSRDICEIPLSIPRAHRSPVLCLAALEAKGECALTISVKDLSFTYPNGRRVFRTSRSGSPKTRFVRLGAQRSREVHSLRVHCSPSHTLSGRCLIDGKSAAPCLNRRSRGLSDSSPEHRDVV